MKYEACVCKIKTKGIGHHCLAFPQKKSAVLTNLETFKHVKCKAAHSTSKEVLVVVSCCIQLYTFVVCFALIDTEHNARCQSRSRSRVHSLDVERVGQVEVMDILIMHKHMVPSK